MKLKTILLFFTSVTAAHGATTVSLANFTGASTGLPIVDNTGTPIAKADSLLQVGTFTQAFADSLGGLDTRTSDQDVIDAFTPGGTGLGMTFNGIFNGSVDSDSDGTLGAAGTPLFALITYTPAGADPQAMVLSFGNTFPEQNAVGAASVDLGRNITLGDVVFGNTASTVPVIVDSLPAPLQNDNFKQGLTFDVGAGNENYTDVNGVLFNTEKTVLLAYPAGKTDANYTIPDGVTSIGESAFLLCSNLTSITIGNGVTSIGQSAFYNCTSLTSISFLGTAPTVGANAFSEVAVGAKVLVTIEALSSFGDFGTDWNGLTVSMSYSAMNGLLVERDARPTQVAYDAAVATARTAGQGDVTTAPASYSLIPQVSYDTVIAERDARPTQASYDVVEAERDARPTQVAYDAAVATARTAGQGDVTTAPASYSLVTQGAYDAAVELAAAELAAAADAAAAAAAAAAELAAADAADADAAAELAELAAAAATDTAAAAKLALEAATAELAAARAELAELAAAGSKKKKAELTAAADADAELAAAITAAELAVAAAADAAVAAELAAVAAVADAAAAAADAAELGARQTGAELAAAAATDTAAGAKLAHVAAIAAAELAAAAAAELAAAKLAAAVATARTDGQGDVTSDPASYSLFTQASYDTVVAERDGLPTQASYDTVVAERDARFTEDQIHAMSADSTIGMNDAGNVEMKINFFESADLVTFAPFTVTPESVSVVDGNICMEFTHAAFIRFSLRRPAVR